MTVVDKKEMRLAQGGLMRCCLGSLDEYLQKNDEIEEGTVVECQHCKSSVILDGSLWRWNREARPE